MENALRHRSIRAASPWWTVPPGRHSRRHTDRRRGPARRKVTTARQVNRAVELDPGSVVQRRFIGDITPSTASSTPVTLAALSNNRYTGGVGTARLVTAGPKGDWDSDGLGPPDRCLRRRVHAPPAAMKWVNGMPAGIASRGRRTAPPRWRPLWASWCTAPLVAQYARADRPALAVDRVQDDPTATLLLELDARSQLMYSQISAAFRVPRKPRARLQGHAVGAASGCPRCWHRRPSD